jgi:hypothetical protein
VRLSDVSLFKWQWNAPSLAGNQAYELRIWSEEEEQKGWPRRGAVAPTQDKQVEVDLQYVPAIMNYGSGNYFWGVVIVEVDSGKTSKVLVEGSEKRSFTYNGSSGRDPTSVDSPEPPPNATDTPEPPPDATDTPEPPPGGGH